MNFALALLSFFKNSNGVAPVTPVVSKKEKTMRDFSFHEASMGKQFQLRCGKPFTVLDMNYVSPATGTKMISLQIEGESEARLYYQDGIADELEIHPLDLVMVD